MKLPLLIAHRGASRYAPENTMLAFRMAHDMGATWVETDVRLTKDHVPVLFHDDSLSRMAGVDQLVHECTFDELEKFNIKDEKIPTLSQLLTFLSDHDMGLNLELKPAIGMENDTAHLAMQTIIESGFNMENLLISSFSMLAIEAAYQYAPQYHYGWLCKDEQDLEMGLTSNIPFTTINLNQVWASVPLINQLHAKGYQVLCFTVNDASRARDLFAMGVESIFSDIPDLLTK